MLVADDLRLGNRFRDHPLIYSVLYKSFVFAAMLVCFHLFEGMAVAWWRGGPLSESLSEFGRGDLKGILSVGALVCVAFIPFFMFREAARVIGGDQLWRLFFARRTEAFTLSVGGDGQPILAADCAAVDGSAIEENAARSAFE